jgi:putative ABC transport system permease protein
MARRHFPDEDPLGKKLMISWGDPNAQDEIIGVVGDIKETSLDAEPQPMIYWPHPRVPYSFMVVVARTASDPTSLARAMQDEIRAIDSEQPVSAMRTMEQVLAESIWKPRFHTTLLGIFAGVALILAAVGIYGVMSYSVTQRTHELGIRMALGARPRDVIRLVVGQGLLLAFIGIAIGLGAAIVITRVMKSFLFEVSATDPVTFAVISLLLMATALLANYIPARRATKVDPMIALRYE